jgi:hypothetical protein
MGAGSEIPIEKALAEAFGAINRVESIHLVPHGEILNVFTVIDNDDEETYDLIYDQERSIMHRFSDIHFDFNVVARRGRSASQMGMMDNPIWQRDECGIRA